jgi:hypothetical protein
MRLATLILALPHVLRPAPMLPPGGEPMIRVAQALRARGDGGRVLGPWSWGHLFDVVGRHPVVLDNFGAAIGRADFDAALSALLSDEPRLAAYCAATGVRYVVLENPLEGLIRTVETAGQPIEAYLRAPAAPGGAYAFRRRLLASFWWRAYYDSGKARPEAGPSGSEFRSFRLVYRDALTTDDPPPYAGALAEVWEFTGQR